MTATDMNNRWLLDWPQADSMPLTVDELSALRRERSRLQLSGILLAAISPVLFLLGLCLLSAPDLIGLSGRAAPILLVVFFLLAVPPVQMAKGYLRRAKMAKQDICAGIKHRFRGSLSEEMLQAPLIKSLLATGLLHHGDIEQSLEVLASGRIWRINGLALSGLFIAMITETATVPEIAHIAAQWLDPIGDFNGVMVHAGKRELTSIELDELRKLARRTWMQSLWPMLLSSLWCFPLVGYSIAIRRFPPEWGLFVILVVVTGGAYFAFIKSVVLAHKLSKDIAFGLVVIVAGPLGPIRGHHVAGDGEDHTVEVLPNSRFAWTVDGETAFWRKRMHSNQREEK